MPLATIAQADREYADNVGRLRPDVAWILSDRDVWYRNPAYQGPPVRHPEDWIDEDWVPDELPDAAPAATAGAEAAVGGVPQSNDVDPGDPDIEFDIDIDYSRPKG